MTPLLDNIFLSILWQFLLMSAIKYLFEASKGGGLCISKYHIVVFVRHWKQHRPIVYTI